MAELKSCPFCGGEAEYRPAGGFSETSGYVRCKDLCCEQHWYAPKKEAIEAWNKRVEIDPFKLVEIDHVRRAEDGTKDR